MMGSVAPPVPIGWRLLPLTAALLFVGLFFVNAWIVDEAYVTFRTVDNFLDGRGLTWNPGERVQGYTHPLWMLVMTAGAAITSEFYVTTVVVSLIFSLLVLGVAHRHFAAQARAPVDALWRTALFILLLGSSKAYLDFTTSGLENPLSHFLCALFVAWFLSLCRRVGPLPDRSLLGLTLVAAAAALNRLDTVLLIGPPLVVLVARQLPDRGLSVLRPIALGFTPVVAWIAFSVVYYGFPFPNTYYAKLATTGIGLGETLEMGWAYFTNSLRWDALTQLTLAVGFLMAILRRHPASPLVGVALYLVYVLAGGAAATHMSGRFFSVPFLIAALVVIASLSRRQALALTVLILMFGAASARSPLKFGTRFHSTDRAGGLVIDTKLAVYEEGAAFLNLPGATTIPNHQWYRDGIRFRDSVAPVEIVSAPGYFGYAAGPDKWIIDVMGLCDPLLARLPGRPFGRGGHFVRALPAGYQRTVTEPGIHLQDPGLRAYYEVLQRIVQGPVFTRQRFRDIWALNLGRHDHLLAAYVASLPRTGSQ